MYFLFLFGLTVILFEKREWVGRVVHQPKCRWIKKIENRVLLKKNFILLDRCRWCSDQLFPQVIYVDNVQYDPYFELYSDQQGNMVVELR